MLSLIRVAAFSAGVRDQLFNFNPAITVTELAEMKAKAQALAPILGSARLVLEGTTADVWIISDPTSEAYGVVVPVAALASPGLCAIRGLCGMVCIEQDWLAMENIGATAIASWEQANCSGPGRDPRLACHVTVGERAHISEKVDVPVFAAWVSGTQRAAATILKKDRFPRKERGHGSKRRIGTGDHDRQKDKDKDQRKPGGDG